MTPRMTEDECGLLKSVLRCSENYVEFGAGGSTVLAASLVKNSILTVDSSIEWLSKVQETCELDDGFRRPKLIHVDIGPTGDWGSPLDPSTRHRWPNYHRDVWVQPGSSDADVYMVDGRFRVACFMQILLHSRKNALIMIHDFSIRSHYSIIKEVAREIATADTLSMFRCRDDQSEAQIRGILDLYEYDSA